METKKKVKERLHESPLLRIGSGADRGMSCYVPLE